MKEMIIYISKEKLVKAVGINYETILKDLKQEGAIKEYSSFIKLVIDNNKAIHLQTILEFYEVKDVPITSFSKHSKKKED